MQFNNFTRYVWNIKPIKMKTWICGDVHGANKALLQCLDRSEFDNENDTLIQLGDITDGWGETYECVETLLGIKNLIAIRGNHDEVFNFWINYGVHKFYWMQGADATAKSYIKHAKRDDILFEPHEGGYRTNLTFIDIPQTHRDFFNKQIGHYVDEKKRCFIHAGFDRHELVRNQSEKVMCWDRDLWMAALSFMTIKNPLNKEGKYKFKMKDDFSEVFIGHTATVNWNTDLPMKAANIYNLDTGAGFGGKLTLMDVETKEIVQSDLVQTLYPNEKGR